MADVIDMATSRARLAALREGRALRRAQQTAAAALESDLIKFAKTGEPKVEKAHWPGGIDDMDL